MSSRWSVPHLGAALATALALVVAACGGGTTPGTPPGSASAAASPSPSPTAAAGGPAPVVIDTDMSTDDTIAIPYLLREPSLEVLAVTVVGTGLAHCGGGQQAVSNILATLGIEGIPISCGRDDPLAGTHAFPADWRAAADEGYGLALERRSVSDPGKTAPELIRAVAIAASRPVTVVALGPMTNLAEALEADPGLPARIERIVAMAGAVDVPGNVSLDPTGAGTPLAAEWNVYADPTAADIVLRSGVPITLVPLDATNMVPLDAAFVAALEPDHAAAPADIAYELVARRGVQPGEYLWDCLASVIAVDPSVATFETIRLQVVTAEGPASGQTARAADGIPVEVAMTADRAAFEARFLAGLRRGAPRPNPFTLAGTIVVRFDGTTCADDRPASIAAGDFAVESETSVAGTTVFVVIRFHEGAGWPELQEYARTAADPTNQPPFVDVTALSFLEAPGTTRMIAGLAEGRYGIVCLHFTENASRLVSASGEFAVAP